MMEPAAPGTEEIPLSFPAVSKQVKTKTKLFSENKIMIIVMCCGRCLGKYMGVLKCAVTKFCYCEVTVTKQLIGGHLFSLQVMFQIEGGFR